MNYLLISSFKINDGDLRRHWADFNFNAKGNCTFDGANLKTKPWSREAYRKCFF